MRGQEVGLPGAEAANRDLPDAFSLQLGAVGGGKVEQKLAVVLRDHKALIKAPRHLITHLVAAPADTGTDRRLHLFGVELPTEPSDGDVLSEVDWVRDPSLAGFSFRALNEIRTGLKEL